MDALNEVRRQWRLHKVIEGSLLAFAGVLGVLLTLVVVDNWLWHPDKAGRFLLACILWGGLGVALLTLVVRRVLEDRRDDFFAALVEQKYPGLHNQLINALQLGRGNQDGVSPGLIEAIVHDADKAAADLDMNQSIDRKPTRRASLIALGALAIIVAYAIPFWGRFSNACARLLLPVADVDPYTETQIIASSIKPGNDRVSEGTVVPFEIRVRGKTQGIQVHLHQVFGDGRLGETALDGVGDDTFRCELKSGTESFDYYLTAGDARSRPFRIDVVRAPRIDSLVVTYTPPAYTGLPARTDQSSGGDIAGLIGTRIDLELKTSKPVQEARLITDRGQEVVLKSRNPDNLQSVAGSFILWTQKAKLTAEMEGQLLEAPTNYQVQLMDTEGRTSKSLRSRRIDLLQDQDPKVYIFAKEDKDGPRMTMPKQQNLRPGSVLWLSVDAVDDYGLGQVRLLCRVNKDATVYPLIAWDNAGQPPATEMSKPFRWDLQRAKLKSAEEERSLKVGDQVEFWAEVVDRNTITGPGRNETEKFTLTIKDPEIVADNRDQTILDYAAALRRLIKQQRLTRKDTMESAAFDGLLKSQGGIRGDTQLLAQAMQAGGLPLTTLVDELNALAVGPMAQVIQLFEKGRDAREELGKKFRTDSLPIQDKIIAALEDMLNRLERNEQAKAILKKIEKTDKADHKDIVKLISELIKNMDLLKDHTELAGKTERLPKKTTEQIKEETLKSLKELDELFKKRSEKWAKGGVNELTKMPNGFIDDFKLRKDVNKIFEEIEKAASTSKAEKIEVSLEDLGAGLATKMKEDLEMWLPDAADAQKWVLEEPLNKKKMEIPEMPLPKALEDLVGDLLQKADEFDQDADDVTSAWGDNLDQAGWGVADGPISTFSAKGKTGNDQPNNNEVSGRSGDGRRGKSSGQMVGDTARGLPGRKTPARVGNERYEPGQLKQEGSEDPNGATGGGKKAGAGRKGLQGGNMPDIAKDMGRLSAKQAGLREKAEQVAQKLQTAGVNATRLNESIDLMKSVEKDLADKRYDDAARKRKDALQKLKNAFNDLDQSTAARIKQATDLPEELRKELLQAREEGYPAGYEGLLKNYFKALSTAEAAPKK
jgi:hypothetical protein